jgi:hypothetical protein
MPAAAAAVEGLHGPGGEDRETASAMKKLWKIIEARIGSPDFALEHFQKSFEHAKKVSDFVGMIARLAFLTAFLQFIIQNADDFSRYVLAFSVIAVGSITFYFYVLFSRVIVSYFFHDVSEIRPGIGKVVAFLGAASMSIGVPISIVLVVGEFVRQVSQ